MTSKRIAILILVVVAVARSSAPVWSDVGDAAAASVPMGCDAGQSALEPDGLRGTFWAPGGSMARRPQLRLQQRFWAPAPAEGHAVIAMTQ